MDAGYLNWGSIAADLYHICEILSPMQVHPMTQCRFSDGRFPQK